MHFRVYCDLELGLDRWRQREDLLDLKPHEKAGLPPIPGDIKSKKGVVGSPLSEETSSVDEQNANPDPPVQQVKRVSITAEDQALLRSPHHFSDNVGVSDDDEKDDDEDSESSKVAEILRQMSQGASPAVMPSTSSGTRKEQFALRKPLKRPIPTSFLLESDRDSPDGSPSASKRVRWSNEAAGSLSSTRGGPFVPSMFLSSHTGQQAATNRFFHKMRRGVVSGKVEAGLPARSISPPLPKAPVLKPIPGLEAYDVLLGRDFISHFNLGNRRFMVLAYPHLVLYKNDVTKQDDIAAQLIKSIREAGGRFVRMDASCGGFEELSERVVPFYVKNVLEKLSCQQNLGGSKGLVQMFQRDCTNIWGGEMSQGLSLDELRTPTPLQVETLRPSKATIPVEWPTLDEETHGVIAPVPGPGSIQKLEPQTPLLDGFKPGRYDVICCRGRGPRKHPGNLWFVKLVESKCERYVAAKGKVAKSFIVTEVLDTIRKFSGDGGFVKKNPDDGKWYEVGDHLAREKIGQCFRDRLHTLYSSSSKSKLERRKSRLMEEEDSVASSDQTDSS